MPEILPHLREYAVLLALMAALLFSSWGLCGELKAEKEQVEERLNQLRRELADKREGIKRLENTEKQVLEELMDLQERISLSQQLLGRIEQRAAQLSRDIDSLLAAQEVTRDSLERKRENLRLRLVNIYKQSRWYRYELLMDSDTFLEVGRRLHLLEQLAEYDRRRIREIQELDRALEEREALVRADKAKLLALRQESESEKALLLLEQRRETDYIEQIRQKRRLALKAAKELEKSVSQMESLIAELEQRMLAEQSRAQERLSASQEFLRLKGKLPWPTEGEILIPYGIVTHPVFKTQTTNPGVDIKAGLGTPVKAVSDGTVLYKSWMRGYGNFVILSHPGGFTTLYGHLLEALVEVDQWVVAGQTIAKVGESGTFLGPSLHFELRQGRETLNPEEWLR